MKKPEYLNYSDLSTYILDFEKEQKQLAFNSKMATFYMENTEKNALMF